MRHTFDYIKQHKILLILIIPGFIFLMLTILPSGSHYCFKGLCGIFFWGATGHDGIWHLALAKTAFKEFPFISPIFSGAKLSGYNYFMDLGIYLLSLFGIPITFTFFKLIPLTWFILFTGLTIALGKLIKDSPRFVLWLLFFIYFGSSFAFVFPLYHNRSIWGASSLFSMQSGQNLTNMQFALSLIVLLLILIIIKKDRLSAKDVWLLGLLLFVNLGLKLYAGAISCFLVGFFYLLKFLVSKKIWTLKNIVVLIKNLAIVLFFSITAIIIFYDPFASLKTGSIFIFSPFSTMHSVIEEPALLYIPKLVNARYFLYAAGGLTHSSRLWLIELFSCFIFLFFSMGLRVFGAFYFLIKLLRRKIGIFDIVIFSTAVFAYILLVLFVQKGQWWNVIQFYYYSLFLLNIFTAEFFYQISQNHQKIFLNIIIVFVVIALSLPGNIDLIRSFIQFPAPTYVPDKEIGALRFLEKQPKGAVLTDLYHKNNASLYPDLKPNFVGEDSAYVSAFSGQPTFFANMHVLQITGIFYEGRLAKLEKGDCTVLKEIKYIYHIKNNSSAIFDKCIKVNRDNVNKIFENSQTLIFRVLH